MIRIVAVLVILVYFKVVSTSTGVIFSATSLQYLNNCTIIKLCENNVSVIIYLPVFNVSNKIIISTYGCPKIIYLPYVSPVEVHEPKITSISDVKRRPFDHKLVHARAFKIRSIRQCPFDETLYLDNDLNIVDLKKVVDWFGVMKANNSHMSLKNDHTVHPGHDYKVHHTIKERNTGVMYLMCNAKLVLEMLEKWEYAYYHDGAFDYHDQGPLITVLDTFYTYHEYLLDLPENYNCRYNLYEVNRASCYINHVHETHNGKPLDPEIVGPRNCFLE